MILKSKSQDKKTPKETDFNTSSRSNFWSWYPE